MPPLAILTIALQIACAVHVIRSGREYYWIFLIVLVPLIGCAVYIVTQVLPELRASRGARRTGDRLLQSIDPQRELRRLEDQLALSDNIDNRLALAEEHHRAGNLESAEELFVSCLSGPHEEDPHMLLKLAQVQFDRGSAAACRDTLERLKSANPDFQSTDGHLLYARALEKLGDHQRALGEYEALSTSFPGEEARVRYGMLLADQGRPEEARRQFEETLKRVKRAPRYYRRKEKRWIATARERLNAAN